MSANLAEVLFEFAKQCGKAKEQGNVNYEEGDAIGKFQFPAAWLSGEISLRDFIEAIMHQLFLGVAESNYELITKWLSDCPAAAKVGLSPFKNVLQMLIKDLRGFALSWLPAYPLTGKKGNLGTGSWVAENWIFLYGSLSLFLAGARGSSKARPSLAFKTCLEW